MAAWYSAQKTNLMTAPNHNLPVESILSQRVTMFADAFGQLPKETKIGTILNAIRTGRWRNLIEPIRAAYSKELVETGDIKKAKRAIEESKKKLPVFCMSGTAKSRTEPREHSGLLQVDLD